MHLPTLPLLLVSALSTSVVASSSASEATLNFPTGSGGLNFGDSSATGSLCFDCTASTSFDLSTTVTIIDGFTVTTSGYSVGKTAEPNGEWTLDIHPHNTECLWGTDSVCYYALC